MKNTVDIKEVKFGGLPAGITFDNKTKHLEWRVDDLIEKGNNVLAFDKSHNDYSIMYDNGNVYVLENTDLELVQHFEYANVTKKELLAVYMRFGFTIKGADSFPATLKNKRIMEHLINKKQHIGLFEQALLTAMLNYQKATCDEQIDGVARMGDCLTFGCFQEQFK